MHLSYSQTEDPSPNVPCPKCGSTDLIILDRPISVKTHGTAQCADCGSVFTFLSGEANDQLRRSRYESLHADVA